MSLPATSPVFVFDYGLTPQQKRWYLQASPAERAAFFLSAPVHIAVLTALQSERGLFPQYLPVIHGVPVGLGDLNPHDDPASVFAAGQAFQERQRIRAEGLCLDLDALGIRGDDIEAYASPAAFDVACDAEMALMLHGQQGKTLGSDPEGLETLRQVGERCEIQVAERLEGPRTLHEALDLKHAVTLLQSPQLRNGS